MRQPQRNWLHLRRTQPTTPLDRCHTEPSLRVKKKPSTRGLGQEPGRRQSSSRNGVHVRPRNPRSAHRSPRQDMPKSEVPAPRGRSSRCLHHRASWCLRRHRIRRVRELGSKRLRCRPVDCTQMVLGPLQDMCCAVSLCVLLPARPSRNIRTKEMPEENTNYFYYLMLL